MRFFLFLLSEWASAMLRSPSGTFGKALFFFDMQEKDHFTQNQDTVWNEDRHKPSLLFGRKFLSESAVSDQNLPSEVLR